MARIERVGASGGQGGSLENEESLLRDDRIEVQRNRGSSVYQDSYILQTQEKAENLACNFADDDGIAYSVWLNRGYGGSPSYIILPFPLNPLDKKSGRIELVMIVRPGD